MIKTGEAKENRDGVFRKGDRMKEIQGCSGGSALVVVRLMDGV